MRKPTFSTAENRTPSRPNEAELAKARKLKARQSESAEMYGAKSLEVKTTSETSFHACTVYGPGWITIPENGDVVVLAPERVIRSLKLDLEEDENSGRVVLYIPEGMHPHFWIVNASGFSTEGSEQPREFSYKQTDFSEDIHIGIDKESANTCSLVFYRNGGSEVLSRALTRSAFEEYGKSIKDEDEKSRLNLLKKKTLKVETEIRNIIKSEIKRSFDLKTKIKAIDQVLNEIHFDATKSIHRFRQKDSLKDELRSSDSSQTEPNKVNEHDRPRNRWVPFGQKHDSETSERVKANEDASDAGDGGDQSTPSFKKTIDKFARARCLIGSGCPSEDGSPRSKFIKSQSPKVLGIGLATVGTIAGAKLLKRRTRSVEDAGLTQSSSSSEDNDRLSLLDHHNRRGRWTHSFGLAPLGKSTPTRDMSPDKVDPLSADERADSNRKRSLSPFAAIGAVMSRSDLSQWIKAHFSHITRSQDELRKRLIEQQERLLNHQKNLSEWYYQLRQEQRHRHTSPVSPNREVK